MKKLFSNRNLMRVFLILTVGAFVGAIVAIWYGTKVDDDDKLIRIAGFLAIVSGISLTGLIFSFISWIQGKNVESVVPLAEKESSLNSTLVYMSGNTLCLIFDIVQGISIVSGSFMVLSIGSAGTERDKILATAGWILGIIVATVVHFILKYVNTHKNNYINKMLYETKKFYDYGEEEAFKELVDKSLRNDMLFRCKGLVLTKDVLLGRVDGVLIFTPIAIVRSEVLHISFYTERRRQIAPNDIVRTIDGILEVNLKNGKTVKCHTSNGYGNDRIYELLVKNGIIA